jgi:cytochrome c biogenesis protein CcdA
MYTQDQELEISRKFAQAVLCVTLGLASMFLAVGFGVAMLAH